MRNGAPPTGVRVAAAAAIGATYVYFLIFAEFALLRLSEPFVGRETSLSTVMGGLGAGGILGSVTAARFFRARHYRQSLGAGFILCALSAAGAIHARASLPFLISAVSVGLSLGWVTVTLVSGLRGTVGRAGLGLICGTGTGAAYAVCNLPWLFAASPRFQAEVAMAACLLGGAAATRLTTPLPAPAAPAPASPGAGICWIGVLTALVWLDSAAFFVIQQTSALKAATWAGDANLLTNAAVHLAAAVVAGWALDRQRAPVVLAAAAVLLALACGVLDSSTRFWPVTLYTAGVSLYSVALVFYPAARGRPGVAAACYSVAGWAGSALGIGMAQHLHRVPTAFAFAVGLAVVLVMLRANATLAIGCLAALLICSPARGEDAPSLEQQGREVYISEGCIHCHSQYVRPQVPADVTQWGPARSLAALLRARPPLFGNRRQGPDLAEVGNRRSPEWLGLHLRQPRSLVPGSRMPDYDYLFGGTGERGEALVAYLSSLGRDDQGARLAYAAAWRPQIAAGSDTSAPRGGIIFSHWCVACHGPRGEGNGPLAAQLSLHPPDWAQGPWRLLRPDDPDIPASLARIIKFGVPGTPMAGHEYFSDAESMAVANYVRTLQTVPRPR